MENRLFPTSAGAYLCQRDSDLIIIKIKGVCPMLRLDGGFDLGTYLKSGKLKEASKEILNNIEIFPEKWIFSNLRGIKFTVFSKNEFHATGKLDLPADIYADVRDKYFLLCQQGVSANTIMRALVQEFKVPMSCIIDIVNEFDKGAQLCYYIVFL